MIESVKMSHVHTADRMPIRRVKKFNRIAGIILIRKAAQNK